MDRRDPGALGRPRGLVVAGIAQAHANPLAQLGGSLLGERDREDLADTDPILMHSPRKALDQHRGLAAAGAGIEQQLAAPALDRKRLLFREPHLAQRPAQQIPGKRQVPSGEQRSGHGVSSPRRSVAAKRHGLSLDLSQQLLELRFAEPIPGHRVRTDVHALLVSAARAEVLPGQRLVEACDSPCLEQALRRDHVQRNLNLPVAHPSGRRPGLAFGAALVVPHDHTARIAGVGIDAVDDPAEQHLLMTVVEQHAVAWRPHPRSPARTAAR